MLAQDKYQAVTNEIEEIQEVRKKVDDMRVKFEKIKEKIENNWSGENKDSYIRKINIINNEEYLVSLNDKNEFEMALEQFMQRHKN